MLFLKSKILSLKGTHNQVYNEDFSNAVVSKVKDTKFERNSQLSGYGLSDKSVVSKVKDTKFERNSQRCDSIISIASCCF